MRFPRGGSTDALTGPRDEEGPTHRRRRGRRHIRQDARVNVALPVRDDVVGVADVPVPIRRTRNEGATGLIPRVITATVQLPSWSIPWKVHTRLAPMVGVPSTPMCTNGLRVQPSTSIRDRRTARVPRTGTTEGSPAAMAAAVVAESASETGSRPPSTSREPWSARPNRTSTYDRRSCPKPAALRTRRIVRQGLSRAPLKRAVRVGVGGTCPHTQGSQTQTTRHQRSHRHSRDSVHGSFPLREVCRSVGVANAVSTGRVSRYRSQGCAGALPDAGMLRQTSWKILGGLYSGVNSPAKRREARMVTCRGPCTVGFTCSVTTANATDSTIRTCFSPLRCVPPC